MKPESPRPTAGERIWRTVFFVLSAAMAASALVDFEAGRLGHGLGDAGASILMLSLLVQFPFVRAIVRASREQQPVSPEIVRKQREQLMQQAEQVRTANPWAERANRMGWALLAISLVLRISGVA